MALTMLYDNRSFEVLIQTQVIVHLILPTLEVDRLNASNKGITVDLLAGGKLACEMFDFETAEVYDKSRQLMPQWILFREVLLSLVYHANL